MDAHSAAHKEAYEIVKEWEAVSESWASMSVRDRYELIKRAGDCSIFAARRSEVPDDDRIQEILRGWL